MKFSTQASLLSIGLVAPFASAAPFRRAADANTMLVLQFANVLEQLETQFYSQALSTFQASDFTTAGFTDAQIPIEQFTAISIDESTHTTVLTQAITDQGATPLAGCSFDFSSVLTDVTTMATTARLVENVGVGAYLGAAHLVTDPVLLTAAASIMTVEARHQTMLNVLTASGTAIPQAFDIPLTPPEVLAIAGGFISGCDTGVTANPSLAVTNTGSVSAGTSLTFSTAAINGSSDTSNFACQMLTGGASFAIALPLSACVVPQGLTGPVAIFITSDMDPLAGDPIDRATSQLVAGPTMAFLDTTPQTINSLVRSSSGSSSSGSSDASAATTAVSTSTIDVASASAVVSSAEAAGATVVSAASATATGTTSVAANAGQFDVVAFPGGPNEYVGPSADGTVFINGWSSSPLS
ncbi:uncharacterized protein STEHIDRAFT_77641 [Stereum hirsutum FP-91666 SS1]|uniref:uncharacterized protein n=1 Tax=Stereum hirsutum (strain FP-91666) TaxID=721885 RepID=UPI000440B10C|nr:uncharacterized protein STEHIDRAFT_77641 [Stereum hirsutum FP-91666 SS1]EIM88545.1 hypothetical protein STEHIDRAFT_77641 [Stereum hirsutum FP-91666 SS1]